MNNKERLLETLSGAGKRELPVICPGGMVAMACREVGETNRAKWQEGHTRPEVMARLAQVLRQATGFENLGVPFCITVEAEAMGGRVDFGSADVEPRMVDYILDGTDKLERLKNADPPEQRAHAGGAGGHRPAQGRKCRHPGHRQPDRTNQSGDFSYGC